MPNHVFDGLHIKQQHVHFKYWAQKLNQKEAKNETHTRPKRHKLELIHITHTYHCGVGGGLVPKRDWSHELEQKKQKDNMTHGDR